MKFQLGLLAVVYVIATSIVTVESNSEGDALNAWKAALADPNNVLESWDPTLVNPCTWFHVTCDFENRVTRVDLGNGGLSGPLVPQLGLLANLQYLQVEGNRITGAIPREIGKLRKLISLGLQQNQLNGTIPSSLGNLKSLRFMRLNSNNLTGKIPFKVIQLISTGDLRELDVSDNFLTGTLHQANKTVTTTVIQDARI